MRIDTTEGKQYSISIPTIKYLDQIEEPLLIRGYFSGKTHPMLSPLVPQIKDLIHEYEVAGNGKIRIEFIDPVTDLQIEEEANQKYGVRPIPLLTAWHSCKSYKMLRKESYIKSYESNPKFNFTHCFVVHFASPLG